MTTQLPIDVQNGLTDHNSTNSGAGVAGKAGSDDILVGESSGPLGASWGFSGAATIDPAGRVVGVSTDADFRDRAETRSYPLASATSRRLGVEIVTAFRGIHEPWELR